MVERARTAMVRKPTAMGEKSHQRSAGPLERDKTSENRNRVAASPEMTASRANWSASATVRQPMKCFAYRGVQAQQLLASPPNVKKTDCDQLGSPTDGSTKSERVRRNKAVE